MKHVMKSVLIGVCLGIALLFVQISLKLDEEKFLQAYWVVALTVVGGAIAINLSYNAFYLHKLRKMAKLWLDENPQKYVDGVEALLKTAKGRRLRSLLTLNLAGGYVGAKEYDRAIAILEGFSDKELKGAVEKVVHRINLCLSYFYTAQYDKAISLYNENQALFQKFRDDKTYGAHVVLIDIIAAIVNKQFDLAQERLATAKASCTTAPFQTAYVEIENTLNELRKSE